MLAELRASVYRRLRRWHEPRQPLGRVARLGTQVPYLVTLVDGLILLGAAVGTYELHLSLLSSEVVQERSLLGCDLVEVDAEEIGE